MPEYPDESLSPFFAGDILAGEQHDLVVLSLFFDKHSSLFAGSACVSREHILLNSKYLLCRSGGKDETACRSTGTDLIGKILPVPFAIKAKNGWTRA